MGDHLYEYKTESERTVAYFAQPTAIHDYTLSVDFPIYTDGIQFSLSCSYPGGCVDRIDIGSSSDDLSCRNHPFVEAMALDVANPDVVGFSVFHYTLLGRNGGITCLGCLYDDCSFCNPITGTCSKMGMAEN